MTLLQHPIWPSLLPYVTVETYSRDGGPSHPRHRLEVVPPSIRRLHDAFLGLSIGCARCGRPIHPIRVRQASGSRWYLNMTCELAVNMGCARSRAASQAYEAIVAAVQVYRVSQAPGLPFDATEH